MTMQLVSMTDFVLSQSEKCLSGNITLTDFHKFTMNYANLLKQPLDLGMFVPVKDCELLSEPNKSYYDEEELQASVMGVDVVNYNEAKEKILIESFEVINDNCFSVTFKSIYNQNVEICLSHTKGDLCRFIINNDHFVLLYTIECLLKMKVYIQLSQTAINQIFN